MSTPEENLATYEIGAKPQGNIVDYPERVRQLRDTEKKIGENNKIITHQATVLEAMRKEKEEIDQSIKDARIAVRTRRVEPDFKDEPSKNQILAEVAILFGIDDTEFFKKNVGQRDTILTAARSYATHRMRDNAKASFPEIDTFLKCQAGSAYFYYWRYDEGFYSRYIIRPAEDQAVLAEEVSARVRQLDGIPAT